MCAKRTSSRGGVSSINEQTARKLRTSLRKESDVINQPGNATLLSGGVNPRIGAESQTTSFAIETATPQTMSLPEAKLRPSLHGAPNLRTFAGVSGQENRRVQHLPMSQYRWQAHLSKSLPTPTRHRSNVEVRHPLKSRKAGTSRNRP